MRLYDVYYDSWVKRASRFGGFDAARPLPMVGLSKGDKAVCVNGPREVLVWNGKEWIKVED